MSRKFFSFQPQKDTEMTRLQITTIEDELKAGEGNTQAVVFFLTKDEMHSLTRGAFEAFGRMEIKEFASGIDSTDIVKPDKFL